MRKPLSDLDIGGNVSSSSDSRACASLQQAIARVIRGLDLTMAVAMRYTGLTAIEIEAIMADRSDLDEASLAAALRQMSKSIV